MDTLQQWFTFIAGQHPSRIRLGLDRVRTVAERLGFVKEGAFCVTVPHFPKPTIITIAGTNGKGSSVALLAAIYRAAGYRVGTYTSPHLFSWVERIQMNGVCITTSELIEAFKTIEAARSNIALTVFETLTLAALWFFQRQPLDLLLLEVGLGGRYDAVNIIDSDLALITQIGLDHTDRLGDTREHIGYQKAGIMRKGCPVVCGDVAVPDSVTMEAKRLESPLYTIDQHFFAKEQGDGGWIWQQADTRMRDLAMPHVWLGNAASALMVVTLLQARLSIDRQAIDQGLGICLEGRQQISERPHWCCFDVAHNPDAMRLLVDRLHRMPFQGKLYAVVGMLADKLIAENVKTLLPVVDVWCIASLAGQRGASVEQLGTVLEQCGVKDYHRFETVEMAYQQATHLMGPQDRMLVCGSFHTVAQALRVYAGDSLNMKTMIGRKINGTVRTTRVD